MHAASFDPGKTTGFAKLEFESAPWEVRQVRVELVNTSCLTWPELGLREGALELKLILAEWLPELVVVENYVVYAAAAEMHVGARIRELEIINCLETLMALFHPTELLMRLPASRKQLWPDARLKVWFPKIYYSLAGSSEHEKDAVLLGLAGIELFLRRFGKGTA